LDMQIAEIASRQYGVVSIDQLRCAGVSDDAVRGRVIAGRLHRVHRGVYAVGHARLSPEGHWLAAVLALGSGPRGKGDSVLDYWGAAVSHRSAACLWGLLPVGAGPADVVIRGDGGKAKRAGICVHRSLSLTSAEVTLRRGIPVTTPARTVVDLCRATAAERLGSVSPRELRRAIRQANVLGLPIDQDGGGRIRSDLERDFLWLCRRNRLPPPEVNVRIRQYLVDFLWRDRQLVVETDGYLYHRGKAAFQDDRRRDLELRRLGYEVVRLSERQLAEERDRVAETLAAILRGGRRD